MQESDQKAKGGLFSRNTGKHSQTASLKSMNGNKFMRRNIGTANTGNDGVFNATSSLPPFNRASGATRENLNFGETTSKMATSQSLICDNENQRIQPKTSHNSRRSKQVTFKQDICASQSHRASALIGKSQTAIGPIMNEMHMQLLLEASNDAQAVNEANMYDSIMSAS